MKVKSKRKRFGAGLASQRVPQVKGGGGRVGVRVRFGVRVRSIRVRVRKL